MVQCMLIAVAAALVNNVVLSQFLGLCPFLGVSKRQILQPEWEQRFFLLF